MQVIIIDAGATAKGSICLPKCVAEAVRAAITMAVGEILDCVQYDTTADWGCK